MTMKPAGAAGVSGPTATTSIAAVTATSSGANKEETRLLEEQEGAGVSSARRLQRRRSLPRYCSPRRQPPYLRRTSGRGGGAGAGRRRLERGGRRRGSAEGGQGHAPSSAPGGGGGGLGAGGGGGEADAAAGRGRAPATAVVPNPSDTTATAGAGAAGAAAPAEQGAAGAVTSFLSRRVASLSLLGTAAAAASTTAAASAVEGSAADQQRPSASATGRRRSGGGAGRGVHYAPDLDGGGPGETDDSDRSLDDSAYGDDDDDDTYGYLDYYRSVSAEPPPSPSWRLKDRMKTVGIGIVLALNIGTDPPDLMKPNNGAVLEAWMDPSSVSRSKAREMIGERLEQQYGRWQLARGSGRPALKFRRVSDPTVDDVRALCYQLRRQARNERILFHFNGRGVPRPTANGEIWVFDKNHTEYIPLPVSELRSWLGKPTLVVLDCSAAGVLVPSFAVPLDGDGGDPAGYEAGAQPPDDAPRSSTPPAAKTSSRTRHGSYARMDDLSSRIVNDTIVLAPCSANEWLPVGPDYPADIFTACLTTPIPMALRWFVANHESTSMKGVVDRDAVDRIPGKATDRKTPLGELNWIFTAVTDSIAWNTLPRPMFQRLFRQDLLVASMFRNYLLADRILRSLNCTPVSHPPLPPGMSSHPLWRAWDLACESLLFHLKDSILVPRPAPSPAGAAAAAVARPADDPDPDQDEGRRPEVAAAGHRRGKSGEEEGEEPTRNSAPPPTAALDPSPFFSEQLTAFEVWLEFAETHRTGLEPPEQLPVLLQVLLSQVHRVRALELLRRFLQLGPWAVNLGLGLGIFPYVMKLLQSQEYKSLLVSIWASIVRFDPSTRVDLLKDGAFQQFVQHLVYGWSHRGGNGDTGPYKGNADLSVDRDARERTTAAFVLAAAAYEYPAGQAECAKLQLHGSCCALLQSYEQGEAVADAAAESHFPPGLRLWLIFCLANMVKENTPTQNEALSSGVHVRLLARLADRDSHVRAAVCYALGCLIGSPPKPGSRSSSSQDLSSLTSPQPHSTGQVMVQGTGPGAIFNSPVGGQLRFASGQQFQPSFALSGTAPPTGPTSAANAANLAWRPHPAEGAGRTVVGGGAAATLTHPQQEFQPVQPLRPGHQQYQGVPSQYMLQQPHYQSQYPRGPVSGPSGFLPNASGTYLNVAGQPMMMSPQAQPYQVQRSHESPSRQLKPSVYEDRRRLEQDIPLMEALVQCTSDLSAVVRYESIMGLAAAVGKYLDAFVVAAEESSSSLGPPGNLQSAYPVPLGFDRRYLPRFVETWKALRGLQHQDPYPAVCNAANKVVSYVHERLLRYRMDVDEANESHEAQPGESDIVGASLPSPSVSEVPRTPTRTVTDRRGISTGGRLTSRSELRRVSSEVTSRDDASLLLQSSSTTNNDRTASLGTGSLHAIFSTDQMGWSFSLPRSELYEWKKKHFDPSNSSEPSDEAGNEELDLLSPVGAARAYQQRRNSSAYKRGLEIAARYACLAPKPPKPQRRTIDIYFEEDHDETAEAAVEKEVAGKKRDLKMLEKLVLKSGGTKTSMLQFHSFEDVLVSCGGRGCVTVWDTASKSGRQLSSFDVGNSEHTRMTTSGWVSEESSSLFYVGCDDGSVRIWGGLLEESGGIHQQSSAETKVSLRAAFTAVGMKAGARGTSGLVCEWQPQSGLMLAGGNAKVINAIDLEAECQVCQIKTCTDANVTTVTTAWDNDPFAATTWAYSGTRGMGSQNVGPHVVVSGHSDGSIKIFDLRAHSSSNHRSSILELSEAPTHSRRTVASRVTGYSEHTGWVVATAFTGYAGRYELVSGTVAGTIKFWDLRTSGSLRTVEVQRSTMTALTVHPNIPLLATGSHAQFIKLCACDGEPLQVLRYHEKMANHRIGPVSCLAFHRYKPILAAGSTDSFIGLYAPSSER